MAFINVSKPEFNIRSKLKEIDFDQLPFEKVQNGGIVQYAHRRWTNGAYSTTSTSMTNISPVYIDFTPKNADNTIIVRCNFQANINGKTTYVRYRLVDAYDNDRVLHTNVYCGAAGYQVPTDEWLEHYICADFPAKTTKRMRIRLQGALSSSSSNTLNLGWSSSDSRTVEAFEINTRIARDFTPTS